MASSVSSSGSQPGTTIAPTSPPALTGPFSCAPAIRSGRSSGSRRPAGSASWPASWAIPAASCSTPGEPSTFPRRRPTGSFGSRPIPSGRGPTRPPPSPSPRRIALGPLDHRGGEPANEAPREEGGDRHHGNREQVDPGHRGQLVERHVEGPDPGCDRLVLRREDEHRCEHEIAGDGPEGEDTRGDEHGAAHGQDDAKEGAGAARALDQGRLLDLARQVLEVPREHPHAEGQRHARVDEEQGEQAVVQREHVHDLKERNEEDGLRDDVSGEHDAPPPAEARRTQPTERVTRRDTRHKRRQNGSGKHEEGVRDPVQEWIGATQRVAHEAPDLALSLEQLLEVLEGRIHDDERIAEDVLLRGLQRLHQHEVNRKEAVDRGEEHQAPVAELHPPPSRVHAASCRGGSNRRNSTRRIPSKTGTSVSESAEAGPNWPALMARKYAWVPMTGKTMRPAVSIHTLARSAKALVSDRNTASARNGLRSGTVTSQKRRHGLFDSRTAHSNSSGGTALMPARRRTPMNELPRQMLNRMTLTNAQAPAPKAPSTTYFRWPMNGA